MGHGRPVGHSRTCPGCQADRLERLSAEDGKSSWEYKTLTLDAGAWGHDVDASELNAKMNKLGGRDGWELTAAFTTTMGFGGTNAVMVIFKRPRKS